MQPEADNYVDAEDPVSSSEGNSEKSEDTDSSADE